MQTTFFNNLEFCQSRNQSYIKEKDIKRCKASEKLKDRYLFIHKLKVIKNIMEFFFLFIFYIQPSILNSKTFFLSF